MSLSKLLDLFSKFENLPVDLFQIRDAIVKDYGMVDRIHFVAANLDPNILRGVFRRYDEIPPSYASSFDVVRVYYANTMSEEWIRLVCCKEMLHIYDVTTAHSLTQDDIQFLIEGLALPQIAPLSPVQHALEAEACALLLALHLLAPEGALEDLRPDYDAKKITNIEVAKKLKLPVDYIPFLFSETYKRHVTQCLNSIVGNKFTHSCLNLAVNPTTPTN